MIYVAIGPSWARDINDVEPSPAGFQLVVLRDKGGEVSCRPQWIIYWFVPGWAIGLAVGVGIGEMLWALLAAIVLSLVAVYFLFDVVDGDRLPPVGELLGAFLLFSVLGSLVGQSVAMTKTAEGMWWAYGLIAISLMLGVVYVFSAKKLPAPPRDGD